MIHVPIKSIKVKRKFKIFKQNLVIISNKINQNQNISWNVKVFNKNRKINKKNIYNQRIFYR